MTKDTVSHLNPHPAESRDATGGGMRLAGTRSLLSVLLLLAALIPATFIAAGCRGKHGRAIVRNDEGEPAVHTATVSSLSMNYPGAPAQLVKGFYGLEAGAWRWTAGHFSVMLKTPPGAAARGGTLTFSLVVAGPVRKQVGDQTLTASIGGKTLKSEKYTTEGDHTFSADVPAASLAGDTVSVDFSVDKYLPPSPADRRELGLIATAIGIESK